MPQAAKPKLRAGYVYRTADLSRWGKNPSRLAQRLVREGRLKPVARGLYVRPRSGRFGEVPPTEEDLLRAFLKDEPFLLTGPDRWNSLGLGSTALFSRQLVYNSMRSGEFILGGMKFLLRRVRFPTNPTPEWFAVDLIENHDTVGLSLDDLEVRLREAVATGRLDPERLDEAASEYGTRLSRALVRRATVEMERA